MHGTTVPVEPHLLYAIILAVLIKLYVLDVQQLYDDIVLHAYASCH